MHESGESNLTLTGGVLLDTDEVLSSFQNILIVGKYPQQLQTDNPEFSLPPIPAFRKMNLREEGGVDGVPESRAKIQSNLNLITSVISDSDDEAEEYQNKRESKSYPANHVAKNKLLLLNKPSDMSLMSTVSSVEEINCSQNYPKPFGESDNKGSTINQFWKDLYLNQQDTTLKYEDSNLNGKDADKMTKKPGTLLEKTTDKIWPEKNRLIQEFGEMNCPTSMNNSNRFIEIVPPIEVFKEILPAREKTYSETSLPPATSTKVYSEILTQSKITSEYKYPEICPPESNIVLGKDSTFSNFYAPVYREDFKEKMMAEPQISSNNRNIGSPFDLSYSPIQSSSNTIDSIVPNFDYSISESFVSGRTSFLKGPRPAPIEFGAKKRFVQKAKFNLSVEPTNGTLTDAFKKAFRTLWIDKNLGSKSESKADLESVLPRRIGLRGPRPIKN